MKFFNIAANYNFLNSLHNFILDEFGNGIDITAITIFLPSRRSTRELTRIFLEQKKTVFLPSIKAIGDIDYDDIILKDLNLNILKKITDLVRPTSNIKYKLLLIEEFLKEYEDRKNKACVQGEEHINKAITMADELNNFLTEVEKNNCDLEKLDDLVADEYSEHWQKILEFLKNFTKKWQSYLRENNIVSGNTYKIQTINYYNENYKTLKTLEKPVIIAGNMMTVESTISLINTLKKFDNSYLIFKGFENVLSEDEEKYIDEFSSHYFFNRFVKKIDLNKRLVENIEYAEYKVVSEKISNEIYNVMLPSNLVSSWLKTKSAGLTHIEYIECDNVFEEIECIKYFLLDFIEKNGMKNIAIIADEEYVEDLEYHLKTANLQINNVFGINFLKTEIADLLFNILNVSKSEDGGNFDFEIFLSLLKNKLTNFDNKNSLAYSLGEIFLKNNCNIKTIDDYINFVNSGKSISENLQKLNEFLHEIKNLFSTILSDKKRSLWEFVDIHLDILEKIIDKEQINECENGVLEYINEIKREGKDFKNLTLTQYKLILKYFLSKQFYCENYSVFPAINIINQEESRLINYDLIVLFNFNDGSFPRNVANDPWMNNTLRKNFGLFSKNAEIGKFSYDFIQYLHQKRVLITRSLKLNDIATFKSRFLQRLETFLQCHGLTLNRNEDILNMVRECAKVEKNKNKLERPKPKFNFFEKPENRIYATHFETLVKNPYGFYCKHALKLINQDFLMKINGGLFFGNLLHSIFEFYIKNYDEYKDNIEKVVEIKIKEYFLGNKADSNLYLNALNKIAKSFYLIDSERRKESIKILQEKTESYYLEKYNVELKAKIDRLEFVDNNRVKLIDYKAGSGYSVGNIYKGERLQLPFEALILKKNHYAINSIEYWKKEKNEIKTEIFDNDYKPRTKDIGEENKQNNIDFVLEKIEFIINEVFEILRETQTFPATGFDEYDNYREISRIDEWLYE